MQRRVLFSPPSSSLSRTEVVMAKTALINRDKKRRVTVKKFAAKRAELFAIINNSKASDEDRTEARDKLGRLPRDSSPVRLRNRCALTGRPRRVFSKFGLGRNKLREIAMRGEIRGVTKESWKQETMNEHESPQCRHADGHPK